jgi:hypothetical protein
LHEVAVLHRDREVDWIEFRLALEATRQIGAWIQSRVVFAATRAQERQLIIPLLVWPVQMCEQSLKRNLIAQSA